MADFVLPVFSLVWAILIICLVISGIWVFFSIRRSFAPVLVLDIIYTIMLEVLCLSAMADPVNAGELPFYLITFVTFLLNLALTVVIFSEWRNTPARMNEYVWWLKIALAITGVYTVLPLGLYYLKLSWLPRHPVKRKEEEEDEPLPEISGPFLLPRTGVSMAPPAELQDRYRDWQFIGQGGFARVFKVTKKDGTVAALKVPVEYDRETGLTFIAEIQNWTNLKHENIVRVIEYNILPVPYFEMEFCDSSLAKTKKPVDPAIAAEMLFDICEGLSYCHRKNVIHRDLKPSNILVASGTCRISDWGLSAAVSESHMTSSMTALSPHYAAPEQILDGKKDVRTDIWQAGVILYELVTGTLPFTGTTIVEIFAGVTTRSPIPPSSVVPAAAPLDAIILRCLRKEQEERYPSVGELEAAVTGFLTEEYTRRLTGCIAKNDEHGAELYCSRLLLMSLRKDDLPGAYRSASELLNYTPWLDKRPVQAIMAKIQERLSGNGTEKEDLVRMARDLVRQLEEERDAP